MNEIIGNSGFKYIEIDNTVIGRKSIKIYTKICIIKDIKTDKELFRLIGKSGVWGGRGLGATKSKDTIDAKRFLGLDNRYYYIEVNYAKVIWGQIQSSGAVIAEDRTIIKQLDFFPMNIETPTVPILNTIPIKYETVSIINKIAIKEEKEVKWIEQIMNQINQIVNQINRAIQLILNQLKQNK